MKLQVQAMLQPYWVLSESKMMRPFSSLNTGKYNY